jgi:predicted permease
MLDVAAHRIADRPPHARPIAAMRELADLVVAIHGEHRRARRPTRANDGLFPRRMLLKSLVHGCRVLSRTPLVTAVAVISIGLGIGGNTAVFSLFSHILRQPLPVAAPEELVNLAAPGLKSGSVSCGRAGDCDAVFSYPLFLDLAKEQQLFSGIAAHCLFEASIGYQDETLPETGLAVSGTYFGVLGLEPTAGRLLVPADTEHVGGPPVAVLSYGYWAARFGRNPAVLGQSVTVNGVTLRVVGVAPRGFDGTIRGSTARIFVPISIPSVTQRAASVFDDRRNYWVYLFARRRPGVSAEMAETGINVSYHGLLTQVELPLQTNLNTQDRNTFAARRITIEDGRRGQSYVFKAAATPLLVLQVLALMVLFISCANVANLLLARAANRTGEMAVRLSVGASRRQLMGQLLLESCLLAILGGVVGLLTLDWLVRLAVPALPAGAFGPGGPAINFRILAFDGALSLGTGVLFGLLPAIHATRPDLIALLKSQPGRPGAIQGAERFRIGLVVGQIALSMGLLTCAGLFTKSLLRISRVDLGINVDRVITFSLNPARNGYPPPRSQQLFADVLARLTATPGVASATAARVPLLSGISPSTGVAVEGYVPLPNEKLTVNYNEIAPRYFRTLASPILAGRDFNDGDTLDAPKVAIANESFAKQFHLDPDPVGRHFRLGNATGGPFDIEIVGLVRDAKYKSVHDPDPPCIFTPYRQNASIGAMAFFALGVRDPESLLPTVRPIVASFDAGLPIRGLRTMSDQVASNVSDDQLMSRLSAAFAGLATTLAAIGLYGVLSYTVSMRTREFGLRMALGAPPQTVQRLVLRQVAWMTGCGGVVGLALGVGAGRLAKQLLYGVGSADFTVLATSAATLTAIAFAAGVAPSIRASRVDPIQALRRE